MAKALTHKQDFLTLWLQLLLALKLWQYILENTMCQKTITISFLRLLQRNACICYKQGGLLLFMGLPTKTIHKLQIIQNLAAQGFTRTKTITPLHSSPPKPPLAVFLIIQFSPFLTWKSSIWFDSTVHFKRAVSLQSQQISLFTRQ